MTELRVALVPLARVNFDMELAEQIIAAFRARVAASGLCVVGSAAPVVDLAGAQAAIAELAGESFDLLLVLHATFADSTMVTALAEAIEQPVFLWAVTEERTGGRLRLNSLGGINLAAHALTLRGRAYEYAYAPVDDVAALDHLRAAAQAAQVRRRLASARIGVVGDHPAGMDTCFLDEGELKTRLGVEIVRIPLQTVFERVRALEPAIAAGVRAALEPRVSHLDEMEQGPLERTLSSYHVLRTIAREQGLDGMALRCWPEFFTDLKCAACGAVSLLSDEQIPSSCEADTNGTVTQLILQWLSQTPAFGTDIVSIDVQSDTTVLWHCGQAPLAMADPGVKPRATVHSNRRLPLLMEFTLKPGRVTLARLSRASGELRLVVTGGAILAAPPSFSGTSGVIRFDRPASQVLESLLGQGLEHHLSLTYGDHQAALRVLAKMLGLPVQPL